MSWEYILVPRISGKISIPPISMTYFDPKIEKWKKISTAPTIIPVKKGKGRILDNSGLSKKEIELLKKDINYIRTGEPVWKKIEEDSFFIIICILTRGTRFFLVAYLTNKFGDKFGPFLEKQGTKWSIIIALVILIIVGLVYIVIK